MTSEVESAWPELSDPADVATRLVRLYETEGSTRYDEAVTQTEHATQSADLARAAGAADELVAAALLHDLGHLLGRGDERGAFRERDLRHEEVAARFLARWFDVEVTEPIRHHVAAKRYLCAVDVGYHATLSPASVRSLELQGGPMTLEEAADFELVPGAEAGVALRRWDDLAKDPDRVVDQIGTYEEMLSRLAGAAVTP